MESPNRTQALRPDEDPIPISALQHWAYCPRQCALIHLEQVFDDNLYTLRGNALHRQVDRPGSEQVEGRRVERALPLWSDALGLIGKADVVEFLPDGTPYPVEYKRGPRHKSADIAACDDIQLAAQAMCLESMTGRHVNEGALYYAGSKRRRLVQIGKGLRSEVRLVVEAVREMLSLQRLPPPLIGEVASRRCPRCSLNERCQPAAVTSAELAQARTRLFDPDT